MGHIINGSLVPGIDEGAQIKKTTMKKNQCKRSDFIDYFIKNEFQHYCQKKKVKVSDVVYLMVDCHGCWPVLGSGVVFDRYTVKTKCTTRNNRIFMAVSYLVCEAEAKGHYILRPILNDEEWLSSAKVEMAFEAICVSRGWNLEMFSRPVLSLIKEKNGFQGLAWVSNAQNQHGHEVKLACLVTNGLIIDNLDAEVSKFDPEKERIFFRDCRFSFHRDDKKRIVSLQRI